MDEVYEPRYTLEVSQPTDIIFPPNMPEDGFFIQFMIDDRYENYYYSSIENLWKFYNIAPGPVHTNIAFFNTRDQLSDWINISYMLLEANIPLYLHTAIIPQIDEFANSMANQPSNASPKVIPILVEITKWSFVDITPYLMAEDYDVVSNDTVFDMEEYYDLIAQLEGISIDEIESMHISTITNHVSSEMLEKVMIKIEEDDQMTSCIICLEEFANGLEVVQTPCKHVFHEGCILQWLSYRNVCPLCRSEIPINPSN